MINLLHYKKSRSNHFLMYSRAERYRFLDNGMATHRVDDQRPIENGTEGLKYKELHIKWGSETAQKTRDTFKLYQDRCLTQNKELAYFTMLSSAYLPIDI